jgi:hypothetical protein
MRYSKYDKVGLVETIIIRLIDQMIWVVDLFRRKS